MWAPLLRGRILALRRLASVLLTRRCASKVARCEAPHMNELPVPCGPWDIYYKDRQAFYNKILVAGALWWLISLVLMIATGSFYLNWGPPTNPGPPSDMMDECSDES